MSYTGKKGRQCEGQLKNGEKCIRRATVGETRCFQHGGGRCECPEWEGHSGSCRGVNCHCHG